MKPRAVILSMPWHSKRMPSLGAGQLKAHLKQLKYRAEARHLHLEILESLGEAGRRMVHGSGLSTFDLEGVPIGILHPEGREGVLRWYRDELGVDASGWFEAYEEAMRRCFGRIGWDRYTHVFFSSNIDQLFSSLLLAKWIKSMRPGVRIAIFGRAVVSMAGVALLGSYGWIDWCIDGEAELAAASILGAHGEGPGWERRVPGLAWRDASGAVVRNPGGSVRDLNSLPAPDYGEYFELISGEARDDDIDPILPYEASRGCRNRCAFCNVNSFFDGYRQKSPERIARDIRVLTRRYGVLNIMFMDQHVIGQGARSMFRRLADQRMDYNVSHELRADVDRETIEAMRAAGVRQVEIGIESLSAGLLKCMGKGVGPIDNIYAMKLCEEAGIDNAYNLIAGFPTETQDQSDETVRNIEFVCHLRPPDEIVSFSLRIGSPCDAHPERFNIVRKGEAEWRSMRQLPEGMRDRLVPYETTAVRGGSPPDYRPLYDRWEAWKRKYRSSASIGESLLSCREAPGFVRILDRRYDTGRSVMLDGMGAMLYRYCRDIRSAADIAMEFPEEALEEMLGLLEEMVDLGIVFREGDRYLSLAIRTK